MGLHRIVLRWVMVFTNDYRIGVADRSALVLSLVYSGSVAPLLVALLNGTTVLSFNLQQQGIVRLSNWIRQEEITVVCNGAVFRALCPYLDGSHQFPHPRVFRISGGPTNRSHLETYRRVFATD